MTEAQGPREPQRAWVGRVLGLIALVAVGVGAGLLVVELSDGWFGAQPETAVAPPQPAAPSFAPQGAAAPAPTAVGPGVPGAVQPSEPGPTFDVVRIAPTGDAVIAGRAAPGARVVLTDRERVVGEAQADTRGEWVIVPDKAMASGDRELGLKAKTADGTEQVSSEVVVLHVPSRPGVEPAIAVLQQRDGSGASQVLQGPAGAAGATANAPTGDKPAPGDAGPGTATASAVAAKPAAAEVGVASQSASGRTVVREERAAGDQQLSLDVVDYDEAGELVLTGRATPGSEVRAYVDDRHIGTAEADGNGAWTLRPDTAVAAGQYRLKVEERSRAGRVMARLDVPFSRAVVRAGTLDPGSVVVQPGNSLWRIARATYGEGVKYTVIFGANAAQIADPDLIFPGQIFVLPPAPAAN